MPSNRAASHVRVVIVSLCLALVLPLLSAAGEGEQKATRLNEVQSTYLQYCGGCHGIQGISVPREVPSLRGQVRNFLCTPDGRAYLVRLPNVALAPISDALLAEMMNFVVFDLDDSNGVVQSAPLYSASEVARLRRDPLTDTGLADYRARVVTELIERCGAPVSLRAYSVASP